MKITKDQFLTFLTDLSLAYELPPLIKKAEKVIEALQNEELEIKGYTRNEWLKFDPNDESTLPPKNGKRIIIAYEKSNNSNKWEVMVEPSTNYLIQFLRTDFPNLNVYWRPFQGPIEVEE